MMNINFKFLLLPIFILFTFTKCYFFENNDPKKWTLMVYANADNNLENYIVNDVKELELADINYDKLRVIVLLDRTSGYATTYDDWSDTRLFEISYNSELSSFTSKEVASTELALTTENLEELDMGNPETLSNFVDFCKNNYESDYYALIIENHGNGWYSRSSTKGNINKAISFDDTSLENNISPKELKNSLIDKDISVIAMDACLMGTIEVIYELRDCAKYIIASPYNVPAKGFNYTVLAEELAKSTRTEVDFSEAFITAYATGNPGYSYMMLRYNTQIIANIIDEDFINNISSNLSNLQNSEITNIRNNLTSYYLSSNNVYADFYELANSLDHSQLIYKLNQAIYRNEGEKRYLSIFWPTSSENYDLDYETDIDFTVDTNWHTFLNYYNTL